MRRVEMSILPEERDQIADAARRWAVKTKYARAPRNRYACEAIERYLDEMDEDCPQHWLDQRNREVERELARWEEARDAGRPLPTHEVFGTLRRTPRIGEEYQGLEFQLPDRTYIRLRNAAWRQGITVSGMLRIIFALSEEEDFD